MAVAAIKGPLNYCEHRGNVEKERINSGGRRRVFVQTETGFVVGLELNRSDNAHTVKRRLQLALNVPTEETSLVCGDLVLKNDLSSVRNDAPLLLTRNGMQRSSSSPCLSPSGENAQHNDHQSSGPIEIIGSSNHFSRTKELVKEVGKAIQSGVDPTPISGGLGGAYYFKNSDGENLAIVKPTDEEPLAPNNPKGFVGKALGLPGLKRSVRVGETGFREVAAFLLDYDSFANVPITALVKVTHSIFNVNNDAMKGRKQPFTKHASKIASFQQYIPHDFDAGDHGTSSFPVSSVHRIGILDIRILNTDRHAGNLLVRKHHPHHGFGGFEQVELIPIDHGMCLPEDLEDPYFEWIHWPQASIPFSEDELEYIKNLDPLRDTEMLRMELPVIREACLRVLYLCTIFLKEAARFGLCLAEIGEMMSRESRGHDEEEPSELEMICIQARINLQEVVVKEIEPPLPLSLNVGNEPDDFQFILECEDLNSNSSKNLKEQKAIQGLKRNSVTSGNSGSTLFRLEESEEDYEEFASVNAMQASEKISSASEILSKVEAQSSCEKSWGQRNRNTASCDGSHWDRISSGRRSVDKLPSSSTYVKLSEMNEEEWLGFLDHFQKLLHAAFVKRRGKWNYFQFRHRQRLGTSCKF